MPAEPMRVGSVGVWAIRKSMALDTSATSCGPATPMTPPEPQKPRVV
jgi:hypothetical protein